MLMMELFPKLRLDKLESVHDLKLSCQRPQRISTKKKKKKKKGKESGHVRTTKRAMTFALIQPQLKGPLSTSLMSFTLSLCKYV
jgi:hypothetical protein